MTTAINLQNQHYKLIVMFYSIVTTYFISDTKPFITVKKIVTSNTTMYTGLSNSNLMLVPQMRGVKSKCISFSILLIHANALLLGVHCWCICRYLVCSRYCLWWLLIVIVHMYPKIRRTLSYMVYTAKGMFKVLIENNV